MPLTTRASAIAYSQLGLGVWRVLSERPLANPAGLDSMEVEWIADFKDQVKTAAQIAGMFPQGARHGSGDVELWLKEARPRRVGANVWLVECRYEGAISVASKPHHLVLMGSATSESLFIQAPSGSGVGDTIYWASFLPFPIVLQAGSSLSLSIRENVPGFEYSYYQRGEPRTWATGLGQLGGGMNIAPPVNLAVRDFAWGEVASKNWRLSLPAGFVFEDLRTDPVPGTPQKVNWVTEAWNYASLYKPSS